MTRSDYLSNILTVCPVHRLVGDTRGSHVRSIEHPSLDTLYSLECFKRILRLRTICSSAANPVACMYSRQISVANVQVPL